MSLASSAATDLSVASSTSAVSSSELSDHCQHDVQFYFDDRFLVRSLAEFLQSALDRGSSTIVVATSSHRDGLAQELESLGVNVTAVAEQGRFVALDAAETLAQFTVNGVADEALFRDVIGNVISCAAAAAYGNDARVVIFGEMVALLWQRGEAEAAIRLEQFWNRLSETHAFHLRCGYPLASFDREVHTELFSRVCGEHHVVIPAEGYTVLADENERLRAIARLQHSEQVLKTQAVERRRAQAQTIEVQSQNQQLVKELRKREAVEDELRRFTRRLLTARDEEQRRIAAELHENTAQLLAALSLYFGVMNEEKDSLNPRLASVVASSRAVSDSLLSEIRKLSHLLHPPTLDEMGLSSALREYLDQFTASNGARVDLEISPLLGRFPRKLETTVFRIIEEALGNLYLDSDRYYATVRLTRSSDALAVEIQTHQTATSGVEAASRAETRIMSIHERAMEHGGTVQFKSDRSGTLIAVTLPLGNDESAAPPASLPANA